MRRVVLGEQLAVGRQRVADDKSIERVAGPNKRCGCLHDGEHWLVDGVQAQAGLQVAEYVGSGDFQAANLVEKRQFELDDGDTLSCSDSSSATLGV